VFTNFKALINIVHDKINLRFITHLNINIDHLTYKFTSQHIWDMSIDYISAPIFVTRDIYKDVVAYVKQQCLEIAT
jgi:hypothetical protein